MIPKSHGRGRARTAARATTRTTLAERDERAQTRAYDFTAGSALHATLGRGVPGRPPALLHARRTAAVDAHREKYPRRAVLHRCASNNIVTAWRRRMSSRYVFPGRYDKWRLMLFYSIALPWWWLCQRSA